MYIRRFQYLYIWKSNLFVTSYTVCICSNIYHTTMIYFVIFGASYTGCDTGQLNLEYTAEGKIVLFD